MEVLHREADVAVRIETQHPRDLPVRRPPARGTQATVVEPARTLVPQPVPPAPEGPLADPQHLRRGLLTAPTARLPPQQILETHPPYALARKRTRLNSRH